MSNNNNIILTVLLPMFRAKEIAWVAMDSLSRQVVGDGIKWELIIAEESSLVQKSHDVFGEEMVASYTKKLKSAGCVRVKYYSLNRHMRLARKWKFLAAKASSSSRYCLLQASDIYSQPERVQDVADIANKKTKADWIRTTKGLYYDATTDITAIRDFLKPFRNKGTSNDMSIRTNLLQKMTLGRTEAERRRGIDSTLWNVAKRHVRNSEGREINIANIETDNWKNGLNIHGFGTISGANRGALISFKSPNSARMGFLKECSIIDEDGKSKRITADYLLNAGHLPNVIKKVRKQFIKKTV